MSSTCCSICIGATPARGPATASRADEIDDYWDEAYPEIDLASAKLGVLERAGYSPIGYFTLPPACREEGCYQAIEAGLDAFLERHDHPESARAIVEGEREEIALYRRYGGLYSYGVYIARRFER